MLGDALACPEAAKPYRRVDHNIHWPARALNCPLPSLQRIPAVLLGLQTSRAGQSVGSPRLLHRWFLFFVVLFWCVVGLSPDHRVCSLQQSPATSVGCGTTRLGPSNVTRRDRPPPAPARLAILISSRGLCFLFRTCKTLSRRLASRNNRPNNACTHLSSSIAVVSTRRQRHICCYPPCSPGVLMSLVECDGCHSPCLVPSVEAHRNPTAHRATLPTLAAMAMQPASAQPHMGESHHLSRP